MYTYVEWQRVSCKLRGKLFRTALCTTSPRWTYNIAQHHQHNTNTQHNQNTRRARGGDTHGNEMLPASTRKTMRQSLVAAYSCVCNILRHSNIRRRQRRWRHEQRNKMPQPWGGRPSGEWAGGSTTHNAAAAERPTAPTKRRPTEEGGSKRQSCQINNRHATPTATPLQRAPSTSMRSRVFTFTSPSDGSVSRARKVCHTLKRALAGLIIIACASSYCSSSTCVIIT